MPELPEVETIKNDLRQLVQGRLVESARVLDPRVVTIPTAPEFEAGMAGQRLERVDRRAKYLLVSVTSGMVLVIQLKLTGQLLLLEPSVPSQEVHQAGPGAGGEAGAAAGGQQLPGQGPPADAGGAEL